MPTHRDNGYQLMVKQELGYGIETAALVKNLLTHFRPVRRAAERSILENRLLDKIGTRLVLKVREDGRCIQDNAH